MARKYDQLLVNIFDNIEKSLTSVNFYWQLFAVLICLSFSLLAYKLVRKTYAPSSEDKKSNILYSYFSSSLLPIFAMIILSVGMVISKIIFQEDFLFFITIQLIALFVFLRFLRILFNSSLIANLVGLFLIPAILLNIFGILEPTILILDSFAINIGKVRISIHTVIQAFVTLSLAVWISGAISKKAKSYLTGKKDLRASTKGIISKAIDVSIYFAVFVIALRVFGVDMTTFAVVGGAIGVGIGFGLQKIASNFISGVILLLEKSVEVGDLIELDGGNIFGTVTQFGGRYTIVEGFDGKEIMVPNEDFIINKVTNWTHNNKLARVEITVGIAYDSDVEKAQEIVIQAALNHPRCLKYPAPECYVTDFADSSVNLLNYFWVADVAEGRLRPKSDVMVKILADFKENGISIPFPHRDILMRNQ
ncbi:MAG: small-conductance mechanosensitive channel [Rickettsiales bacterium]|jgi:small-conductance mechanosensitive channel